MNVFSLFYSVLILDISLMVYPATIQAVSQCGDDNQVAFFCANTAAFGSSVFLATSSVPTFTNVSCRCDLQAPGGFYLASLLSSQDISMSDILTVNGKSIGGMVGDSSKLFQSMYITFSADTGNGIPVCIKISAVLNSTIITAKCLTDDDSGGSGPSPEETTKGIIIGAAGGAIVVLVAVILAVVCFYRKRRSDKDRKQTTKAKQPEEDMTECAMYSSADDDKEKGDKKVAADGSKYSTEPEYSYSTVKVPYRETHNGYEDGEEAYNHLHQKPPQKRTENVYTVANFKIKTKENENETNDYNYSTVQKPRAGK